MFFATAFADMKVTLNTTYSSNLDDTSSDEYATFTKDFQQYTLYLYNNLKKSHKVPNLLQSAQWSVVPIDFNDVFFHVRAILQTQTLMLLYTTKNSMIVDCLSDLNLLC
jgi:hypothetical protein